MTSLTLDAEPACPGDPYRKPRLRRRPRRRLRAERSAVADIPRTSWDELAARNPWATPFSGWAFQRAWWDAYRENAHEETLVLVRGDGPAGAAPVAIVPLMHRHEVEPTDALTHTRMRHGADVAADARPADRDRGLLRGLVPRRLRDDPGRAGRPAGGRGGASPTTSRTPAGRRPWDVVDLRRLRCGDPAADALAAAFGAREIAEGWTLNVEREDVCPVVTLPFGADIDGFLATLGKKQRHEIRRKVRRAEAVGEVRLDDSADPLADLDAFIELHQKRWGDRRPLPGHARRRPEPGPVPRGCSSSMGRTARCG